MGKLMYQIELVTSGEEFDTISGMTTWVEKDPQLKVGSKVKVKDDDRWWTVTGIYPNIEIPFVELKSNRGWDNNNYDKHDTKSLKERTK